MSTLNAALDQAQDAIVRTKTQQSAYIINDGRRHYNFFFAVDDPSAIAYATKCNKSERTRNFIAAIVRPNGDACMTMGREWDCR